VKAAPVANFSANNTNPCVNTPILFTDSSTGNPTSWSWDFPGGSPSTATGQGPKTVTYSAAGSYTVNLTVSNACGSDTETKINYITVKAVPVANFSANNTNPCVNTPILFTDSSTGNPTSWSWDFPGGSPSTASTQGPHTVTYSGAGSYTVNLTVSNACGSDTETKINYITVTANRYNLTVNVTPSNGGNVTVNGTTPTGYPNTTTWNNGDVVTLNATAASDYHFVNWTGNLTGSTNPTNITMNDNKNVTANFALNRYNLTVNVTPSNGGSVTADGQILTGYPNTTTWNNGDVVTLNATAASGYDFANWTGDVGTVGNVTSPTTNITMNGNYSIVANFTVHEPIICVNPPSLSLKVAPNTTVTKIYTITNCGGGTLHWDSSNITYVPNGNMTWLTQNITSGTLTANASHTVLLTVNTTGLAKGTYNAFITITGSTFIFPIDLNVTGPYNLMISSKPGGHVTTPGEGTFTYDAGTVVDLVAVADSGYYFVNWTGDVGTVANVNSATTNITMDDNYSIVANFTEHIVVIRDLPPDALDPDAEYPGMTFDVWVNFTAPVDEFNAIGLTDLAPAGWEVETDINWCSPVASWTMSPGNKVEYSWSGESSGYDKNTTFSAMYKVTIPATASPGIHEWPCCPDMDEAWVEYWFGPVGPYKSCITGEYRKIVTVPGKVWGETRDVNADLLTTTLVVLLEDPAVYEDDDSSTEPDALYKVDVDDTGQYWLNASKYCYFDLLTKPEADGGSMPGTRNPWHDDYINFTTVELLAAGYNMDFEGDYGLVPKACNMSYAMKSVNHWLFVPTDALAVPHPEWQLSSWKAMESVHSWQFPCGCNT
jgi:PKD repeat protein